MKFKTLNGRLKDVNISNTRIDWDGKSLSDFQANCKKFFYPYWRYDIVCEEFRIPASRMSIDILNVSKRLAVEVQGVAHYDPKSHFHGGSKVKWLRQIKRDDLKRTWIESNGYVLIEVFPDNMPLTKEWVEKTYDITL